MKKIFTASSFFPFIALLVFTSCAESPQSHKTYSASIASGNVKSLSEEEIDFIYGAHNLAHYNLQLANEGLYRSTAVESATIAQEIVKLSQKTKEELSELAARYELILPQDMTRQQKEHWKELVKEKGWEFDKKFAQSVQNILKISTDLYSKAATSIENEAIKNIAIKALDELEAQNELALNQREKIKARTTTTEEIVKEGKKKKRNKT